MIAGGTHTHMHNDNCFTSTSKSISINTCLSPVQASLSLSPYKCITRFGERERKNLLLHGWLGTLANSEEHHGMEQLTGCNLSREREVVTQSPYVGSSRVRSLTSTATNFLNVHKYQNGNGNHTPTFVCLSLEETASSQIRGRNGSVEYKQ